MPGLPPFLDPPEPRYNLSLNLDGVILRCDNVTHGEGTHWVDLQLERLLKHWINPVTLLTVTFTPGVLAYGEAVP
jgi:hypothetical protein